jgi:hypothetical protein
MTAINAINSALSKSRDAIGTAAAIGNLISTIPGVPSAIGNAVGSLFGTGTGLPPSQNRRDLNNFLSNVSKLNGFTRPAYFYVEFGVPFVMRPNVENASTLSLLCESTALPGVALQTSEIRRYGYGPLEKKPYLPAFVDTTFTFLADGSGLIQKFFYKWMNSIVKFDEMPYGPGGEYGMPFEVSYKDTYATDIVITTVDEANNDILNVRLRNAFPIFMGDVSLSWADSDSIARVPITFSFYNWKIENININQLVEKRSAGLIQNLIKAGTAIQTLASLKKPNNVAEALNVVNNSKIAIGGLLGGLR